MPASILVVDDDPDMVDILREWLTLCGYDVQTAASGTEAFALAKSHRFDAVVTDLDMPGLNGLQLLSMLKGLDPDLQVIFLTGKGTMGDAISALREGRAFDFLQKPLNDLQTLTSVLERALSRRPNGDPVAPPPLLPSHIEPLSAREREIMALLAEGLDNKAIADRLVLSEKTIQNHLTRIYEKLKVSNRTQAVVVSQQYGLL